MEHQSISVPLGNGMVLHFKGLKSAPSKNHIAKMKDILSGLDIDGVRTLLSLSKYKSQVSVSVSTENSSNEKS